MIATQVVGMASAAGAVEILMSSAAEAVHDVEGTVARSLRRGSIEGAHPHGLPGSGNGHTLDGNGTLAAEFSRDDVDVLTDSAELVGNLPRYVFDAASVGSEAFDDDRDTQWRSPC